MTRARRPRAHARRRPALTRPPPQVGPAGRETGGPPGVSLRSRGHRMCRCRAVAPPGAGQQGRGVTCGLPAQSSRRSRRCRRRRPRRPAAAAAARPGPRLAARRRCQTACSSSCRRGPALPYPRPGARPEDPRAASLPVPCSRAACQAPLCCAGEMSQAPRCSRGVQPSQRRRRARRVRLRPPARSWRALWTARTASRQSRCCRSAARPAARPAARAAARRPAAARACAPARWPRSRRAPTARPLPSGTPWTRAKRRSARGGRPRARRCGPGCLSRAAARGAWRRGPHALVNQAACAGGGLLRTCVMLTGCPRAAAEPRGGGCAGHGRHGPACQRRARSCSGRARAAAGAKPARRGCRRAARGARRSAAGRGGGEAAAARRPAAGGAGGRAGRRCGRARARFAPAAPRRRTQLLPAGHAGRQARARARAPARLCSCSPRCL